MTLFVDGAARGNPGPAGIAAILVDEDGREVFVAKEYIGETTNNVAEYRALILGLSEAVTSTSRLNVCCDSELVVKQINGEYKVKNAQLKELIARVQSLAALFGSIEIVHVPRERNVRADEEANAAIDEFVAGDRQAATEVSSKQERLFDV